MTGGCAARPARWVCLALLCWLVSAAGPAAQELAPPAAQYVVMPFDNGTGEGRVHWLTEASAIILTDDLQSIGVPAISYEDRMRALDRIRVPPVASLSHATAIRLGNLVGATHAILGRFDVEEDTLRVRARVLELEAGRISADVTESGPLEDLFAIYARILQRVLSNAGPSTGGTAFDHPPPAAFEQYVKGLLAQVPATRISYLTHARRLTPSFQRPRLALWSVYHEQGEHAEALAVVEEVPDEHRLFRRAQFLASVSLMHLERHEQAFETLATLNAASPDPALFNNMGIARLRLGDDAEGSPAIAYFGDALRLDAADADVMFNLGYAYFLAREHTQAVSWLRETVRRTPADAQAHYVLGAALQALGSGAEGAREKELAVRLSAELAEFAAANTGGAVPPNLERMKTDIDVPASLRAEQAIAAADQENQRQAAAFHLDAARRLDSAGREGEALAALHRAVFVSPYDNDAHLLLGRLYLRGGRVADAIDALKISIWSADTVAARLALAEAYIAAEDSEAARLELEVVLAREPANQDAQRLLERLP